MLQNVYFHYQKADSCAIFSRDVSFILVFWFWKKMGYLIIVSHLEKQNLQPFYLFQAAMLLKLEKHKFGLFFSPTGIPVLNKWKN